MADRGSWSGNVQFSFPTIFSVILESLRYYYSFSILIDFFFLLCFCHIFSFFYVYIIFISVLVIFLVVKLNKNEMLYWQLSEISLYFFINGTICLWFSLTITTMIWTEHITPS